VVRIKVPLSLREDRITDLLRQDKFTELVHTDEATVATLTMNRVLVAHCNVRPTSDGTSECCSSSAAFGNPSESNAGIGSPIYWFDWNYDAFSSLEFQQ
jgi:hypothetical protein